MAKIIKVAEVQRRRRERANNALAIVLRLKQGFENVIANVMADQDRELYLTVLFAVQPQSFKYCYRGCPMMRRIGSWSVYATELCRGFDGGWLVLFSSPMVVRCG